jgi:hypothetical protein
MRESDVEGAVEMVDRWAGTSVCWCGTPDQDTNCLRCDLEAIRKALLAPSLGCFHRKMIYYEGRHNDHYSLCDNCGKKVRITKEQFDTGVESHG